MSGATPTSAGPPAPSPGTAPASTPVAGTPGAGTPGTPGVVTPGKAPAPLGGTYFDNPDKKSFADVPIKRDQGNGIPTTPFLDAAESVVGLFDLLGSTAFALVKSDMAGNILKIRTRHLEAEAESDTLQNLVVNEIKAKKHTAAEGMVWLIRGFDFTAQALRRNMNTPQEELSDSFQGAYQVTLKEYHNWFVKKAFGIAMGVTPTRKVFYSKLGDDESEVQEAQEKWLAALEEQVGILKAFQATPQAQWK